MRDFIMWSFVFSLIVPMVVEMHWKIIEPWARPAIKKAWFRLQVWYLRRALAKIESAEK